MKSALFFRIVGFDANGKTIPIQFNRIEDTVPIVPAVENSIATRRGKEIFEFKAKIRSQLQTSLKVPPKFAQSMQLAIRLLPSVNNRIGLELNVGSVVPNDPVEVPRVPHLNPVFRECAQFGSRSSHRYDLIRKERHRIGAQ